MTIPSILLPILSPLIGALLLLVFQQRLTLQKVGVIVASALTFIGSLVLLIEVDKSGYAVLSVGGWEAPYGIALVADRLSAVMVSVSSFVTLAVSIFSVGEINEGRVRKFFYPLFLFLIFGVNGAFLTGDLFNLYVWFEIMLIASFVLMSMGGEKGELEGGLKYVCLNLLSSVMFLAGAGIIYGKTGTLNLADIALNLSTSADAEWAISSSLLLFVAFSVKAGLFPFFFWLPASYHTPPSAISAVFAGLLTKVGVYALFRAYTLVFVPIFGEVQPLILVLSILTMVTGVLGAASQFDMRRILSFHIVSQIGYMTLGLALMTPLALTAAIFYLVHHIIVKTNLFLISGIVIRLRGSCDLAKVGGLAKSAPWLAVLFFIPAFSLGGIPPLSGFWAKFAIVKAGVEAHAWWSITFALLVGVLTLYSMTKIWAEAFWKKQPESSEPAIFQGTNARHSLILMVSPVVLLTVTTVLIGLFGAPLFSYSQRAADQLLNPGSYIDAVLPNADGGGRE